MNYYNPNNMYGQPYNNYQYNQPLPPATNNIQQPQQSLLNGKIVDSEDIVRATEVPIGSYGVFPKADLSEIYIKTWNNNGTTRIIKYQPIIQEENNINNSSPIDKIFEKIEQLENKIDCMISGQSNNANNVAKPAAKKEVDINAY